MPYIKYRYLLLILALIVAYPCYAQPNAGFTSSNYEGCAPHTVSFTSTEQGSGYTHTWDFGNGTVSNGPINPSRVYNSPGTYTVKHTITGSNGTATATKSNFVIIHATPKAQFTASPVSGCPPLKVNFTDQSTTTVSGGLTYMWVLGSAATPATSTSKNPSATYNTSGTYNVTLEVTNSKGCKASVTKSNFVQVLAEPILDFTATATEFCPGGGTTTFTPIISGAQGPYTYFWNLGNGNSTAANPTHTYSGTGPISYTVSLTVTAANGCVATITKPAFIKILNITSAFTSPASVCAGVPVSFSNQSTSGTGANWTFGDGGFSNQFHPLYTYYTAGTYTVTLTSNQGACIKTSTKTIVVHPLPNPTIVVPAIPCPAPQSITFSTTPTMSSYDWSFDTQSGTVTSTAASPTVNYPTNGTYKYSLKIKDANGCERTINKTIDFGPMYIKSTVNGNLHEDSGCVAFKAQFEATLWKDPTFLIPYGQNIKTIKWDFGDGNTSTAISPLHTYTDTGVYHVKVEIETENGCKITDSLLVKVGDVPIIYDIAAYPATVCPKQSVTFVANVKGYKPLVYVWDFGDGGQIKVDDPTANAIYHCPDTFDIKLKLYHRGCQSVEMVKKKMIQVLPPCARFFYEVKCNDMLKVEFADSSKGDSTRLWKFGDGATDTSEYPTHRYAAPGTYKVTLIVYNPKSGCIDSMLKMVTVGRNQPDMTASTTSLCKGDSVTFIGKEGYSSGFKVDFYWYINSVYAGAGAIFSYRFNAPGKYTIMVVSVMENNDQCRDSFVKTDWITVGGPAVGYMSNVTQLCLPGTVSFTDTSAPAKGTYIIQRAWHYGTLLPVVHTAAVANASFMYPNPGQYDIKLIVTDNLGCKDSLLKPKYISAKRPLAAYTPSSPACAGAPLQFNNQSQMANTYEWDMGDGYTTTQFSPFYSYTNRGSYNTRLIATDDIGCKDTAYKTLVLTRPYANFTISDSISVCPPLITDFDATPSVNATSYRWNFDDGASPGVRLKHTVAYNSSKAYNIQLVVTDALGCKDTLVKQVQVLGYAGAFSYDTTNGCAPLTVNFTSKVYGNVPSIIWDFGDGNTMTGNSTQQNVSYTYKTPGYYIPRMIFSDKKGCSIGSDGPDTIIVDDVTADFDPDAPCQFSTVIFTDKSKGFASNINKLLWTFHDGTTSNVSPGEYKYGPPGKYPVKLMVATTRGCMDSIEKEVTIHAPMEVDAGGDTIICLRDSVQLFPTGGVSYRWLPSGTLSCTNCNYPFAFPKVKSNYTVISTDINGCHDTAGLVIDIKTHVTSIVGEGGDICQGEELNLSASGARTYLWAPADYLNDATSANPIARPIGTTNYRVIAYEGRCIPDTSWVEVIVYPKPTVSVKGEQTIVAGTTADLIASGNHIVRFLWSPTETLSCTDCADPVARPYKTTTYTVKVFSKYECVDSAHATIKVLCDENQLFVPNTFTPNGDGMNDIFMVRGTGITNIRAFRIYSRWGEVLFEKTNVQPNDPSAGWDGTHHGAQLPPDVYIYTIEGFCENGDLLTRKGDVTIIR